MGGREIVEGKHHVAVLAQTLAGLGIFVLVAAQEAVVGRQGILSGGRQATPPPRFIARKKAQGKRGGAASGKVRRRRTEIRDTMILAWWRAGHTQQAIADFFQLTQVRVCQILKRDKDLPTPKVLHPLPRLWEADPLAPDFGGVIEPRKPRPEPENPVQFDPEPIQTSLLPST